MKNKSQVDTTSMHDSTVRMGIAAAVILIVLCLAIPVLINIVFVNHETGISLCRFSALR